MNRRDFLRTAAVIAPAFGGAVRNVLGQASAESKWRTYDVTTTVRVVKPVGRTRVWLPLPLQETNFQRVLSQQVQCEGGETAVHQDHASSGRMLVATFASDAPAILATTQRVSTRDWSVALTKPSAHSSRAIPQTAASFLRPTRFVPTDGIVQATAREITKGATSDLEKTRAIYDWIVENTQRDAKVRGCGVGDIRSMLLTGDLRGKCADLNALFVGLAKASGVPARDVYGIRMGRSNLECRSLRTSSEAIQKSQHCRAEVYLTGFGWVPMDPADVRKVMLEEPPGNLTLSDAKVQSVRKRLFGSWEMNWMAYNYAQDVELPGSNGPPLHFFMYPQAETDEGRLDCLDPDSFHYEINSRELVS